MTIDQLNRLNETDACAAFEQCCTASRWVDRMVVGRPYEDLKEMLAISDSVWEECDLEDYLEAFSDHDQQHHAPSGDATMETLQRYTDIRKEYEQKFGHPFVICAPGKATADLLAHLQQRLQNVPEKEVMIAAAEQNKITHMRLKKLVHINAGTIA